MHSDDNFRESSTEYIVRRPVMRNSPLYAVGFLSICCEEGDPTSDLTPALAM